MNMTDRTEYHNTMNCSHEIQSNIQHYSGIHGKLTTKQKKEIAERINKYIN